MDTASMPAAAAGGGSPRAHALCARRLPRLGWLWGDASVRVDPAWADQLLRPEIPRSIESQRRFSSHRRAAAPEAALAAPAMNTMQSEVRELPASHCRQQADTPSLCSCSCSACLSLFL
jgi:hypothetical protein